MKLFKLTFLTMLLGAIFAFAPASTFAQESQQEMESAEACAEAAEASVGLVSLAAAFLLVPSGIYAIRRRRQS